MEEHETRPEPTPRGLETWIEEVRLFLLKRMGDARLAADLAQEAGTRLLRELQKGKSLHAPRAWLFRAARNLAVDEVRRRAPAALGLEWQSRIVDPRSCFEDEASFQVGEGRIDRSDLMAVLPSALDALPARDRGYLESIYLHGGHCTQIAQDEQISLDAARVRLHRARRRLRTQLMSRTRS